MSDKDFADGDVTNSSLMDTNIAGSASIDHEHLAGTSGSPPIAMGGVRGGTEGASGSPPADHERLSGASGSPPIAMGGVRGGTEPPTHSNRRENITDWALDQYRTHYSDPTISKWDIFYYVYGLLHHPSYRERYAANLKRDLPRIPFQPDFRAYAEAGKALAKLHLEYESLPPYPLQRIENREVYPSHRVEKMKLSKDGTQVTVNDFLTLAGIPAEAHEYKLGSRSALQWVIEQYQVKTDSRSGITNDPNRPDNESYIVDLVGQVVRVSVETVALVKGLPEYQ